jgi:EmrB/QacA subfamily drug resistance transporter
MSQKATAAAASSQSADSKAAGFAPQRGTPHWPALPVVLAGMFMTILNFSIVNVALPSMQRDLAASPAEIQLVVAGYALTYGAFLVTGGRLGDRFGRRRVYMTGLAVFALTSLSCGVATTAAALVVSSLAQGAAAALLFPQVLSILNVSYTGAARARAFTWYGFALGTAFVGGQVLGGVLIRADLFGWGWRTCFLIQLPVALVALLLTRPVVAESRSATARGLDVPGVVLVTAGLGLLICPLVLGREYGWPPWSIAGLVLFLLVFALFLRYQSRLDRRGGSPLIAMALVRSRSFLAGIGTVLATYAGLASFFLVFTVYLQEGEGFSPLGAGIAVLPAGLGFVATSLAGALVSRAVGHRNIAVGAVLQGAGEIALVIVVGIQGDHVNAWMQAVPLLILGAGMGVVITPLISRVLSGIAPDNVGSASGMLSTMQQVGNSLGVALIGIIFYGIIGQADRPGVTYAHAFQASMIYAVVLAAIVAVLAIRLPRAQSTS